MPKYRGRGEHGYTLDDVTGGYNWEEFEADNDEQAKPENSGFAEVENVETGEVFGNRDGLTK